MPRLTSLNDNMVHMLAKMSGGNPGAITAMAQMMSIVSEVDPQDVMQEFGVPLILDTFEIYEDRIWKLYHNVCYNSAHKVLLLLRSVQLCIYSNTELNKHIDGVVDRVPIDWDWINSSVCSVLSEFKPLPESILAANRISGEISPTVAQG